MESLNCGSRVIATGQLVQRNWTTDDGEKRSRLEMQVDEIGPSLRYATARVAKAVRTTSQPIEDPWPAVQVAA